MAIDPNSLKSKPHRPIKDIAADILGYPMNKPEGVPVQFLPLDSKTAGSFKNAITKAITSANDIITANDSSALQRNGKRKMPKQAKEVVQTPEQILAYSEEVLGKLQNIIQGIADNDTMTLSDKKTLSQIAYPLISLMAQAENQRAADYRDPTGSKPRGLVKFSSELTGSILEEARRAHVPQDKDTANHFDLRATNLRNGVMQLVEELARALNIQLTRSIAKN